MTVSLSHHQSTCLSIHPSTHPSAYPRVSQSIHLSISLSIYLSTYLSTNQPIYPPIYPSINLPTYLTHKSLRIRAPFFDDQKNPRRQRLRCRMEHREPHVRQPMNVSIALLLPRICILSITLCVGEASLFARCKS